MTDGQGHEVSPVSLLRLSTKELVYAELWDAITDKNLADWEAEWRPETDKILRSLNNKGIERQLWPQSRHWDWGAKLAAIEGRLSNQSFSIVCEGMTQAMMITDLTKRARIENQKNDHQVYVEYLEAAPWNRKELVGLPPRFAGTGSLLIRAAIEFSKAEGYKGRIGLHSLPQANDFYSNRVGMTDLGPDPAYGNRMRYFEMTPEQAETFIEKGNT